MKIQFKNKEMIFSVLFTKEEIQEKVKQLGEKINSDYGDKNTLVIVIVLNGALVFAADLIRHLCMPTEVETMRIKSYNGTHSEKIQLLSPLPDNLKGKHILIVEDVIESGQSICFLQEQLKTVEAASVRICALLSKPKLHTYKVDFDYVGFEMGNHFIIGYGLDLDGQYRNLPYIAQLTESC